MTLISRSSSARRLVTCLFIEVAMDFFVHCDTAGRLHFGLMSDLSLQHHCRLIVAASCPTYRCGIIADLSLRHHCRLVIAASLPTCHCLPCTRSLKYQNQLCLRFRHLGHMEVNELLPTQKSLRVPIPGVVSSL
jgi:hypothetical protein